MSIPPVDYTAIESRILELFKRSPRKFPHPAALPTRAQIRAFVWTRNGFHGAALCTGTVCVLCAASENAREKSYRLNE
jgi:hypothetical protein